MLLCGVFVSCFASVWNPKFSAQLDLDDRQGFIASSAKQQKKKKKSSVMAWIAVLCGLSAVQLAASSWPEEFVQRYEAHGLALLHTNEADWVQRTNEYGLRRPTHACQIFVYRAFDL